MIGGVDLKEPVREERVKTLGGVPHELVERHGVGVEVQRVRAEAGEVEQRRDQAVQRLGVAVQPRHELETKVVGQLGPALLERQAGAEDHRERGPDLVRGRGQEVVLQAIQLLELLHGVQGLLEAPRVVQGQARLRGEELERLDVWWRNEASIPARADECGR